MMAQTGRNGLASLPSLPSLPSHEVLRHLVIDARIQGLRLRPATPEDQAFLLGLRKQTMTEHLSRVGLALDDDHHRQRLLANYADACVICVADEAIGLCKAYRSEAAWVLMQIQVASAWQGRGVGADIITALIAQARQDGLPVSLSVLKGNPAKRLYERLGFREFAQSEHEYELRCQ
jgi:ribosomal protein S18 acetylase RimI-like enzyme